MSDPGQLPERRLRELHSAGEVRERIGELAAELVADYPDTLPVFIAIAEGALRFSDLLATALASRGRAPEVRNTIDRLLAVFTPAITMLMAVMIGTIVMSVLMAIMGINELVG